MAAAVTAAAVSMEVEAVEVFTEVAATPAVATAAFPVAAIVAALTGAITEVAAVTAAGAGSKAAAVPTVARAQAPLRWALPELGLLRVEASAILLPAGTDLNDLATLAACPRGQEVPERVQGPVMQV